MRSSLIGLGFHLVDFPFRLDMSSLKICSTMSTSSVVTGQFCIILVFSNALKFQIVSVPIVYSFLAAFAQLNYQSGWFSFTVSIR